MNNGLSGQSRLTALYRTDLILDLYLLGRGKKCYFLFPVMLIGFWLQPAIQSMSQ